MTTETVLKILTRNDRGFFKYNFKQKIISLTSIGKVKIKDYVFEKT